MHFQKFHLRLLLLYVPGATSFTNLQTVEGELCPTFREACIRRNLLVDDNEYDQAMAEASQFQMPSQLRSMFVTICVYCEPSDPLQLWITHQDTLTEDYTRTHDQDMAVNNALHDIERVLRKNGSSCAAIGLPSPQGETTDDDTSSPNEPPPTFDDLTEEQQDLAENVLCSVSSDQEEAVPNLHYVREDLRLQQAHLIPQASQKKVACATWTGIATTLMILGRTVHGLFKLPVPVLENSTCKSRLHLSMQSC